jgi:drug/metabolite transporter (DMT)-like permease
MNIKKSSANKVLANKIPSDAKGIFYLILSGFFAAFLIALVRKLSAEFHVFFIIMMRNFFGFIFFIPQILHNYQKVIHTKKIKLHIWRSINGVISMSMWFYAVSQIALSEAVSISFIVPITTTIAAIIYFNEKLKKNNILALIIGFVGILIILRPGFKDINIAHLFCLIATSMWTISNVMIKKMTKTESSQTIVFYMSIIMLIVSIPFAFPYMKSINFENFLYFAALGLAANLTHLSLSSAFKNSDLSTIQPFDFIRLIFTGIISYFAFNEIMDFWVVIGSIVIIFGVILVVPRRKTQKRKILKNLEIERV